MHGRFKMRRVGVFVENEVGEGRVWLLVTDPSLTNFCQSRMIKGFVAIGVNR